jgi:hypothetical protein
MEDFDSLNEKQLESLERGLSDLKNNRVMTSDEFWKELLSKKEQQELLDEIYENYCKSFENQTLIEEYSFDTDPMTQFMFINKCKTDSKFSEKWGLTIEERELSLLERREIARIKLNRMEWSDVLFLAHYKETYDKYKIPTKLITIKYNDKTIENYEFWNKRMHV